MKHIPFRILVVSAILPFAIAAAGVALQLAWLGDLPATIATHWDFAGRPDSYGPAWTMPLLLGVIGGIFFPLLFGFLLARTVRPEGPTAMQKFLAVVPLFVVTLLGIIVTASVALQRDGAAEQAPVTPVFGLAVLVALVVAAAGWFLMPRAVPGRSTPGAAAPRIDIAAGETVVWIGHARFATWVLFLLCGLVALVTALIVFVIAIRGIWPLAIIPVIVALSVLGTADWRVRVDASGLDVRPMLGWPRYRIPLSDIASASTSDLVALGEFGGFGLRWGTGGRVGVITRAGEALRVTRRNGRTLVVTVDDAGTAAGLLTTLAARSAKG